MKPNNSHIENAAFFQALSHRRRQMLCEILIKYKSDGLSFGKLQHQSGLCAATLSHHLRFMDQGGILRKTQKGRETWVSIDFAQLQSTTAGFGGRLASAA